MLRRRAILPLSKGRSSAAPPAQFFASVRALIGARAFLTLLQLFSLPLLTRLLDMRDFALMALGMAVPLFANAFSDAGMGRSLVRRPHLGPAEWSSVFWFLFLTGAALAGLTAAAAPIFAKVMQEPDLVLVVLVLSSVPFLQSLMSAHQAALERAYRFDQISSVTVSAGIAGLLAAMALAVAGAGVWALVAQQVVTALLRAIGFAWFSAYQPHFAFSLPLLRPHLRFGKNTLLFSGVMTLQNQAPVLAFGPVFGTLAVSLWSMSERAARLSRTALAGPVSQVTLVSMSRQWREGAGAPEVAGLYLASTRLLATVLFPSVLVIALAGEAAFVWLLSDPWRPVATVFALAVPGLLTDALASSGARVFMVADRTDLRLRMAVERCAIGLLLFLAALPLGFEAAILTRSLFAVAYLPRYWAYIGRCIPLDRLAAARQLLLPVAAGAGGGLAFRTWMSPMIPGTALEALAVLATAAAATGLAALLSWRPLKADINRLRASAHKSAPAAVS
ncbi:oligosaccharide flippase family protein [Leisingera sp. S232]|uniref:oligosaccharide flippase family protein n=1 Tax=Leisingera sp. S232 TaxID=3415132 RepID=UPI00086CE913|nr:hypothetical protein AB838_16095 [Rhodobacteraceae bacterium (ex Bugula neritina AB1)]